MALTEEQKKRISDEEDALKTVQTSLEQQISWSHARLRTEEQRAQDLTASIVAARRDVDKQMLASDEAVAHKLRDAKRDEIETLNALKEKPYFARIVLEEADTHGRPKEIEYKLGVAANTDCRIIDWRKAPIAKLYYEYKEGEEFSEDILGRSREGRVKIRNKVDIEEGVLRSLSCGLGAFVKDPQSESWDIQGSKPGRRGKRGALPNVLQLITAEQFQMITEDAQSAVLIQGIAGSGKTTVALYRLAWLLHEDNSDVRSEEVAIVVFSKTLQRYIRDALPAIGISDVRVATYVDWAKPTLKKIVPSFFEGKDLRLVVDSPAPGVERVKRSMAMLLRLEEFAERLQSRVVERLQELCTSLELPRSLLIHVERSLQQTKKALNLLADVRSVARSLPNAPAIDAFIDELEAIQSALQDYPQHLLRVLAKPEGILYWDESKLLDRDLLQKTREATERTFGQNMLQATDIALLLRLAQCLGQSGIRLDTSIDPYRHLVLDEVQDFGATELASIIGSVVESSQLTIVGDSSQQVGDHTTFPGWEKLRSHWALGDELAQFHFLSVSHRSTLQIMKLADHVLGERKTETGRNGSAPLWYHCRSEESMVREALSWLQRITGKYPDMLIAVICKDDHEARYVCSLLTPTFPNTARVGTAEEFSFDEGILVTTVREVKGLEFEAVLIWGVSAPRYPARDGARRRLYVALTRAEEYVCMVSWGKPSPLLPSIHSKLVRGFLEEPPPEDKEEPLFTD